MNLHQQPQQCDKCKWIGPAEQMRRVRQMQFEIPYYELVCPECGCTEFELKDQA